MRVFLANDGAEEAHVGCRAVSQALNARIRNEGGEVVARHLIGEGRNVEWVMGALQSVRTADAVIVNGEGTIHHGRGGHLIGLLALAQALGKYTALVNAVLQDLPETFAKTLRKLDVLHVREPRSAAVARAMGAEAEIVPDLCIEASWAETGTRNFQGGTVVGDAHPRAWEPVETLRRLPDEWGRFPLATQSSAKNWWRARGSLGTAGCYVTGRHHGVYLALLAGIPVVPMSSNSHKVEGLCEMLDIPICRAESEVRKRIKNAVASPERYQAAAERLKAMPRPRILPH